MALLAARAWRAANSDDPVAPLAIKELALASEAMISVTERLVVQAAAAMAAVVHVEQVGCRSYLVEVTTEDDRVGQARGPERGANGLGKGRDLRELIGAHVDRGLRVLPAVLAVMYQHHWWQAMVAIVV